MVKNMTKACADQPKVHKQKPPTKVATYTFSYLCPGTWIQSMAQLPSKFMTGYG